MGRHLQQKKSKLETKAIPKLLPTNIGRKKKHFGIKKVFRTISRKINLTNEAFKKELFSKKG